MIIIIIISMHVFLGMCFNIARKEFRRQRERAYKQSGEAGEKKKIVLCGTSK